MGRAAIVGVGIGAAVLAGSPASGAEVFKQVMTSSSSMSAGELLPHWGGTPLIVSPHLSVTGFDTLGGQRTLVDVAVYARVTFSNVRMDVINVSQLGHGPMVAQGSSGFGATVGNPYVLMDPIEAWHAEPLDPGLLPNFGVIGEIDLSFEAVADLSPYASRDMVEDSAFFDVYVSAFLDARSMASSDGSLVPITQTNDVSEWMITIDAWAEYSYTTVPAPGSALALAGLGLLAARRRRG